MKRRYSLPLWILLSVILLLLVLQLALPYLVRNYLNDKLADMGEYHGHIEDVDLAWWRGAYRINGLNIEKKNQRVPVPLLKAPGIDLAVSWHALWYDHAVVARVIFEHPELNFVDGGDKGESQTGKGVDWRDQLDALLPITLNEIRVIDGQLSFRNFSSDPQVNIYASDIQASLYNLTNTTDSQGKRVANFDGKAKLFNHAPMEAKATFDPFTEWQDFQLSLRVTGVNLKQLNDFSRAYGKFDFASGTADLVTEIEATDSQLDGYIKPLLRNVEVFNFKQDIENKDKSLLRGLWEAVVGGGQAVLKNQRKDQFATRIQVSGTTKNADISPFQAFVAILRNAFVQAFTTRFEHSLNEEE